MNPVYVLFGNTTIRTVYDSFASGNQEQKKQKRIQSMFCLATLPSELFMIPLQAETKNKIKSKNESSPRSV